LFWGKNVHFFLVEGAIVGATEGKSRIQAYVTSSFRKIIVTICDKKIVQAAEQSAKSTVSFILGNESWYLMKSCCQNSLRFSAGCEQLLRQMILKTTLVDFLFLGCWRMRRWPGSFLQFLFLFVLGVYLFGVWRIFEFSVGGLVTGGW
jgi:hypothetical protein